MRVPWLLTAVLLSTLAQAEEPALTEASKPRVGQEVLTAHVPDYPHLLTPRVPLGDQLTNNGMPMNLQSFRTKDSPRQVLEFYRDFFAAWNYPMQGDGDLPRKMPYPSISVVDEVDEVDYHVIAIPETDADGSRATTVLLALNDISGFRGNLQAQANLHWGGLPAYPSAQVPARLVSHEKEMETEVVTFSTHDPIRNVVSFYEKAMAERGFHVTKGADSSDDMPSLVFNEAGSSWEIRLTKSDENHQTMVMASHRAVPTSSRAVAVSP
jgi:hypothetical protein